MQRKLKKIEEVGTQMVRRELFERKFTQSDLAPLCAVTSRTLNSEFCRGFTSRRLRLKLEWALQTPFWSTADEWAHRRALASFYGCDLFILTLPGLTKLAVRHGITNWKIRGGYFCRSELLRRFSENLNTKGAHA